MQLSVCCLRHEAVESVYGDERDHRVWGGGPGGGVSAGDSDSGAPAKHMRQDGLQCHKAVYFGSGCDVHILDELRGCFAFVLVDSLADFGSRDLFMRTFKHCLQDGGWWLRGHNPVSEQHDVFLVSRGVGRIVSKQIDYFYVPDNSPSPDLVASVADADAAFVHGYVPSPIVWTYLPALRHVFVTRRCQDALPPALTPLVQGIDEMGYTNEARKTLPARCLLTGGPFFVFSLVMSLPQVRFRL